MDDDSDDGRGDGERREKGGGKKGERDGPNRHGLGYPAVQV